MVSFSMDARRKVTHVDPHSYLLRRPRQIRHDRGAVDLPVSVHDIRQTDAGTTVRGKRNRWLSSKLGRCNEDLLGHDDTTSRSCGAGHEGVEVGLGWLRECQTQ